MAFIRFDWRAERRYAAAPAYRESMRSLRDAEGLWRQQQNAVATMTGLYRLMHSTPAPYPTPRSAVAYWMKAEVDALEEKNTALAARLVSAEAQIASLKRDRGDLEKQCAGWMEKAKDAAPLQAAARLHESTIETLIRCKAEQSRQIGDLVKSKERMRASMKLAWDKYYTLKAGISRAAVAASNVKRQDPQPTAYQVGVVDYNLGDGTVYSVPMQSPYGR